MKCPRCGLPYKGYPATSRRDNKTRICPACGVEEAQIDAGMIHINKKESVFSVKIRLKHMKMNA